MLAPICSRLPESQLSTGSGLGHECALAGGTVANVIQAETWKCLCPEASPFRSLRALLVYQQTQVSWLGDKRHAAQSPVTPSESWGWWVEPFNTSQLPPAHHGPGITPSRSAKPGPAPALHPASPALPYCRSTESWAEQIVLILTYFWVGCFSIWGNWCNHLSRPDLSFHTLNSHLYSVWFRVPYSAPLIYFLLLLVTLHS